MIETKKINKKRKKSGSLISFILFILASGAVFYFGWVQFELPENTYAVLFSKTSGYDKKVLEPGQFNWKWERILPTNSKLIKIQIENRSVELNFTGELLSSQLYSSILPQEPDFSYNMTFSISYRLNKDYLPQLLDEKILDGPDLKSLYNRIEAEYVKIVKERTLDYFTVNLNVDSKAYRDLENILLEKIKTRYYYIEIQSLVMEFINIPDLELYNKSRNIYFQILDERRETEIASERWAIQSKVNLDTKLEILSKYGELLSKYPILVDYFALDPESQVLDISNLRERNFSISDD